jgi:hypothetical protein
MKVYRGAVAATCCLDLFFACDRGVRFGPQSVASNLFSDLGKKVAVCL